MGEPGALGDVSAASFDVDDRQLFAVFLSHNSRDKPLVERIAERLKREGLEPWLDSWCLVPGTDWQRGLTDGLAASSSCAVFVGPADLGAWANQEVAVALDRAAADPQFRLFLVLLPGLPEQFDAAGLLPFLRMRTWVDYRRGVDDERAFHALVSAINGVPLGPAVPIEPSTDVCPYRGLEPFEEEHEELFFGRDADVQRLLEKLKTSRFLAVLGASGSGKSSLVRAGIVPALKHGAAPDAERWEVGVMRPGPHPLEALAVQLLRLHTNRAMQPTIDGLATDARTLHLATSLALAERSDGTRLLLVVDQFEEAFTICRDEAERRAFFANLLYAATIPGGRVVVVAAMRADFYQRCGAYPELAQQLAAQQYLVSPMQADGLRQAIEEPARRAGLRFEPGLVATILDDVANQPGGLPLLEQALLEIWRRRSGGLLTLAGYRDSGGVQGAIAERAEEVFGSLTPPDQEAARRTFLRLTQPGEGTEDTRRRADVAELAGDPGDPGDAELRAVVAALVDARLLTSSRDETSGAKVVEIAHEALIRGWPRFRAWIDEDRAGLRVHRRLTEAAYEWMRLGHDDGGLLRGARLAEALEWRESSSAALNHVEREFLTASERAEENELARARRQTRRLRVLAIGLAALLVGAVGAAVVAKRQTDEADAQRRVASSRALASAALTAADTSPDVAMLTGLEAYRRVADAPINERFEARRSVLTILQRNPGLSAVLPTVGFGLALSPDGHTLAAIGAYDAVSLWDVEHQAASGKPLTEGASALAFGAGGRVLAVGYGDGTARLWDVATRTPLGGSVRMHNDEVTSIAADRQGRMFATGSTDGTVRLWDVARRAPVGAPLSGHVGGVASVAFSPNGRTLAAGSDNGTVVLWDIGRHARLGELSGHRGPVSSITFSTDGRTLATGGADQLIRFWNVKRRASLGTPVGGHDREITALAFSRDEPTLVSADQAGTVRFWNVADRTPVGEPLQAHQRAIYAAAFSADGTTLALGSVDGTIRIHATKRQPLSQPMRERLDTGLVAFAPGGRILASAGDDGAVRLWDVDRATPLGKPLAGHTGVASIAFSPDGRAVAVGGADGTIRVWRVPGGTPVGAPLRGSSQSVASIAFRPDGRTLVSATDQGTLVVWDLAAGKATGKPLATNLDGVHAKAAVSPDARLLAIAVNGGDGGTVRLWDVERRAPRGAPLAGPSEVEGVTFGPDGRTLVVRGDATVRLWDLDKRTSLGTVDDGSGTAIMGVTFSPDGRTLALAGGDGSVQLWDVERRAALGDPIQAHSGSVSSVAFSPDGSTFASASADGIRLWKGLASADFAVWRERICGIVGRNLTAEEWRQLMPEVPRTRTCPAFR